MKASYKHDPLSAISEADATGEVAEYFADIRSTMRLPLLTSIWRILAGVNGGLPGAWQAAKPLFESGYPDLLMGALRDPAMLPVPPASEKRRLESIGLPGAVHTSIREIIDVYTRSNSLNLLVLTALFADPAGELPHEAPSIDAIPVSRLPRLLEKGEIDPATWQLLLDINQFGASPDEPGLATLWRHLAHWPGVLSVLHDVLKPLQDQGVIAESIKKMLEVAKQEGSRLATLRTEITPLPEMARHIVFNYVTHPGLVVRMVAIGNGLSVWLQSQTR